MPDTTPGTAQTSGMCTLSYQSLNSSSRPDLALLDTTNTYFATLYPPGCSGFGYRKGSGTLGRRPNQLQCAPFDPRADRDGLESTFPRQRERTPRAPCARG